MTWMVKRLAAVVLLLMILYYIVFGNVAISGIALAMIGFTLTFGASVFGLMKMGSRRSRTSCPPTGVKSWPSSRPPLSWVTSPYRIRPRWAISSARLSSASPRPFPARGSSRA